MTTKYPEQSAVTREREGVVDAVPSCIEVFNKVLIVIIHVP